MKPDQLSQKILLLWLNDDSFKPQPLTKLNCLRNYLQSADPTIKLPFKNYWSGRIVESFYYGK